MSPSTTPSVLLLACCLPLIGACTPELCVGDCDEGTDDSAAEDELAYLRQCNVQSTIDASTCGDGVSQAGELCFGPGVVIPLAGAPETALAGDFDGDGMTDLLWSDEAGHVTGRAGAALDPLSTGSPLSPIDPEVRYPALTGVGDFDGDGLLDVVGRGDEAFLLRGDGTGGFAPLEVLHANTLSWGPTVLDEDGDGDLDLAIVDPNQEPNEDNYTLVNDGTGTFTAQPRVNNGNPDAVGDLDGVGPLDYVTRSDSMLHVLARGEAVESSSSLSLAADHLHLFGTKISDLDADGHSDLMANVLDHEHRNSEGFEIYDSMVVFLSDGPPVDGSPSFAAPTYLPMDCGMSMSTLDDVDGDGALDIVASHYAEPDSGQSASLVVRRGDGLGGFDAVARTPAPVGVDWGGQVLPGDFDGDGRRDVAVFNGSARQIVLYRGAD